MALDNDALAARAKLLLSSRGEDVSGLHLYRLISLIPNAKRKLAVMRRGENFRKDFTLTITAGVVSLTAHLSAAEPLILDLLKWADIRSTGSTHKWQWTGNRSTLSLQPSVTDLIHFTVEGISLYTNAVDATATCKTTFEPSLATVETQGLDDELVEILAGMVVPSTAQVAPQGV